MALRGSGGSSQVEVNAYGRVIRELERKEGQPGAEVQLSIDIELQRFTRERLGDESASVVVLDVRNGDVLTMVSSPSFDPNGFNRGLSSTEWQSLVTNPRTPLINKAISGRYAPGSTFKMCVLLAALEKGSSRPPARCFVAGLQNWATRGFIAGKSTVMAC